MVEERTPAIVLRARVYGESDKIVTFLTRDWGKITGIAKGAKRSQRRFVNVLESFTHVQLRFRPIRADELAFIFGCDLLRSFRAPSRDLQRYGFASYLTELIDVMVAGRESGPELYELLLQGLTVLEEQQELPSLFISAFELLLLMHTGYAPNIDGCQRCGLSVALPTAEPLVMFSPSLGGLLCMRCQDRVERTEGSLLRLPFAAAGVPARTAQRDVTKGSPKSQRVITHDRPRALARAARPVGFKMLRELVANHFFL